MAGAAVAVGGGGETVTSTVLGDTGAAARHAMAATNAKPAPIAKAPLRMEIL
jgi:hypothetical protein